MRGQRVESHIEAREPDLAIGARIGRYVILERVGNGAMGVVYGAYDPELDRKIALKLLRGVGAGAAPLAKARMMREAKAMARLSHPNVAAVHDVGEYEERIFLATEFLSGGTVRSWLEGRTRTWREIVGVFVSAGHGLAAAHAAGLVHRDFKPDNVLLDKEGRARVVDFGLARNAEAAEEESKSPSVIDLAGTREGGTDQSDFSRPPPKFDPNLPTGVDLSQSDKLDKLTRTGALMGTPAYMAPEQFAGEATDERTDQFSFCVALYEALYGQRPFDGDTLLALSASVTGGVFRAIPKERDVPAWIRRAVLRGLRLRREDRYPSMTALIAALEADPAVKVRRRFITAGIALCVAASGLVAVRAVVGRGQEIEGQIRGHLAEAQRKLKDGQARAAELRAIRVKAFGAFDEMNAEDGEILWERARQLVSAADAAFSEAETAFEAALVVDSTRAEVRASLADALLVHLELADELRLGERAQSLRAALARHDVDGRRRARLETPPVLTVHTTPTSARLTLERSERDPILGVRTDKRVAIDPAGESALTPGSYVLTLAAPGRAEVRFPFELAPGQRMPLELVAPQAGSVPEGFVYVPAGRFWFGDADERLRTDFLNTVPLHQRRTGSFLIARHETTYRDWIGFLEALSPAERSQQLPAAASARGSLRLTEVAGGWQLSLQTRSQVYVSRSDQPFAYVGRKTRARQNWLDFPVGGILVSNAERYLRWLRESGRVPGARLCTELEWERAARGADDRTFPHGEQLLPDDADYDLTYGRVDSAYGPDEVGSHPRSRSPFGVDDMVGNIMEFVSSSQKRDEIVIRGGAYYFGTASCRSTNREVVPATYREDTAGLRVCASVEGETLR